MTLQTKTTAEDVARHQQTCLELEADAAELTRQLEVFMASQKTQQDRIQELWQMVEELEAKNLSLAQSCKAAGEQEAALLVGASTNLSVLVRDP